MIAITENDYNIVKQRVQTRYVRLNILDFQMRVVDEISGNLLDCSFNIDANSDLRRSCSLSVAVFGANRGKLIVQGGSEIFLDKFVQPYVGIENIQTGEIQWYNQGIYLINQPSYDYDAQTDTLKFQGLDLMSKLTGVRNGQLEGIQTIVKRGENVRQAIIETLALGGFTKYIVSECTNVDGVIQAIPNDITVDAGGTVYDILSALRDILPSYQMYFDVNGVFHYELIPSGQNEQVIIDDELLKYVLVSESTNTDFEAVKNYIEVYGRSHDIEHYADANVSGSTISMTISSLSSVVDGIMVGFTTTSNVSGQITMNVNSSGAKALVDGSGSRITSLAKDTYWVAVYQATTNNWLFMGHQQAQAKASDTNPESPFYVDGSVGRIRIVLSGGDYDNIQTDELAQQRADYELYLRCRLQDTESFYIIPIPWLDVNVMIEHNGIQYLIQSIAWDTSVGSTMSIVARKYYPLYPEI